jgi:hypothetical protein
MRHLGVAAILLKTSLMRRRLPSLALVLLWAAGLSACGTSTSPTITSPTITLAFASRIQEHGSAWRSFTVPTAGSVTVQLTSVSQANAVVGLGIGTVNGANCVLSQSLQTAANATSNSPQITTTLSAGTYCVQFSDVGNLTTIVDFVILIVTPS